MALEDAPTDAQAPKLPRGLSVCPTCGEIRGKTRSKESTCLCEGIPCKHCGAMKRRPISNHYNPESREWWHTPWFGYMMPCKVCGR